MDLRRACADFIRAHYDDVYRTAPFRGLPEHLRSELDEHRKDRKERDPFGQDGAKRRADAAQSSTSRIMYPTPLMVSIDVPV